MADPSVSAANPAVETTNPHGPNLNCRFYEQEYPEVEDVVIVEVKQIADMGAYVQLLEYNNKEGMILLSELSRRRIRSINKLIKVGRNETVIVLRVDREKGYIDLSKRRVSPEDVTRHEIKYSKAKAVHSIMRHCAETLEVDLEPLYQAIAWPLQKKAQKLYGPDSHTYDAFAKAITDEDEVFEGLECSAEVRKILMAQIKRRLAPTAVKMRADVEVTCFSYEGIDAIKAALFAGEEAGTDSETTVQIRLIAPPLYVISTASMNKQAGIDALNRAIAKIQEEITARKGRMVVKQEPHAVSEKDEQNLADQMLALAAQNEQKPGDDSNSGSESDEEED